VTGIERSRGPEVLFSPGGLKIDFPFLGGVHLLAAFSFEENRLDLLVKKVPSFGIPWVEPVVVDEKRLML